ncbi:hypothetical protein sos41_31210 [Alphaproteobacteria bacterium SO-S41]|nr:hypothetical protein sos41_31210 [Alphaproteobacteria bacterium SO-S41]
MSALIPYADDTMSPARKATDEEIEFALNAMLRRNAATRDWYDGTSLVPIDSIGGAPTTDGKAYMVWTGAVWSAEMVAERRVINSGDTIAAALDATDLHLGMPILVTLNLIPVARADWAATRVRDGDVLLAMALPQGGKNSQALRILAAIAILVVTAIVAPELALALGPEGMALFTSAETALAVSTAVVAAGLNMAVNALMPAPKAQLGNAEQASPTYSISGSGNFPRLGQAVPEAVGCTRHVLDSAAEDYIEYENDDPVVHKTLSAGIGKFTWEEFGFADTYLVRDGVRNPAYDSVQYQIVHPGDVPTLFTDVVKASPEVSGAVMVAADGPDDDNWLGGYVLNAAGTKAIGFGVDVLFPRGLGWANNDGTAAPITVTVGYWARPIDEVGEPLADWHLYIFENITRGQINKPVRCSFKCTLSDAYDRWEVRGRVTSGRSNKTAVIDETVWGSLKAYFAPSTGWPGRSVLLLRAKANEQVQGNSLNQVYAIKTRWLPWRGGGGWAAPAPTRAIAPVLAYMVRRYWPDSRLDVATLETLHATWESRGDKFDFVFDQRKSAWEQLRVVARAGRARPLIAGGIVSFIRDEPRAAYASAFTPLNTVKGSFALDTLFGSEQGTDCVEVIYTDERTWKIDASVLCVPTGSPGLYPKRLVLPGVQQRAHAFREGIYEATSDLKRRTFVSIDSEMEGRALFPGGKIAFSHDVPRYGSVAELKTVQEVTDRFVVTAAIAFDWRDDDLAHYATFTRPNGRAIGPFEIFRDPGGNPARGWIAKPLPGGAPSLMTLLTIDNANGRRLPSHFVFGKSLDQFALDMRVVEARPKSWDKSSIALVNDAPEVYTADEVDPPAEVSDPDGPDAEDLTIDSLNVSPGGSTGWIEVTITVVGASASRGYRVEVDGLPKGDSRVSPLVVLLKSGPDRTVRVQAKGRFEDGPWFEWTGDLGTGGGDAAYDDTYSPAEKQTRNPLIKALLAAQPALSSRATGLGITTTKTNHELAIDDLADFLDLMQTPVPWDEDGVTSIDGAAFQILFEAALATEKALQTKIDGEASKRVEVVSGVLPAPGVAQPGKIYLDGSIQYQVNGAGTAFVPVGSVGAPTGTKVGDKTVTQLLTELATAEADIVLLNTDIADVAGDVSDLSDALDDAVADQDAAVTRLANLIVGRGESLLPDPQLRDPTFWNAPAGVTFGDTSGWRFPRYIVLAPGAYDFSSDFFPVAIGASYKITARIVANPGFAGNVQPLIHMPSVAWFSLKHGEGIDIDDAPDAANAIVATSDTGDLEWVVTNPSGVTNNTNARWQLRIKGSWTGAYVAIAFDIVRETATRASVTAVAVAREDGDTALAGLIEAMDSRVEIAEATLTTHSGTLADQDGALAAIETELTAARDGEADLSAKLTEINAARVDGDSAEAVARAVLEAKFSGRGESLLPDPEIRDPSFWNLPAGVTGTDLASWWEQRRGLQFGDGTYDFSTDFFPVNPGETCKVRFRCWNAGVSFAGAIWPVLHLPGVAWFSLKHGQAVDPSVNNSANAIVAGGDTLDLEWVVTNPTGITNNANRVWQLRFKASFTGGPVLVAVDIVRETATRASVTAVSAALSDAEAAIASQFTILSADFDDMSADLEDFGSVAVDALGKASAIKGFKTNVGGKISGMTSVNDGDTSEVVWLTDVFKISDGTSDVPAFMVNGGRVELNDAMIRNLSVYPSAVATIAHRVAVRPNLVPGSDGVPVTFTGSYGSGVPYIKPVINSPPAVSGTETWVVRADAAGPTGFTPYCKKFTPGTPTGQTSNAGTNIGGTPAWRCSKPTTDDADGGNYVFTFSGTAKCVSSVEEIPGSGSYETDWYCEAALYYRPNGGSYTFIRTEAIGFHTTEASLKTPGVSTKAFTGWTAAVNNVPAIGANDGSKHFGVHPGVDATITAFSGVTYVTTSASSPSSLPGTFMFEVYPPS